MTDSLYAVLLRLENTMGRVESTVGAISRRADEDRASAVVIAMRVQRLEEAKTIAKGWVVGAGAVGGAVLSGAAWLLGKIL